MLLFVVLAEIRTRLPFQNSIVKEPEYKNFISGLLD